MPATWHARTWHRPPAYGKPLHDAATKSRSIKCIASRAASNRFAQSKLLSPRMGRRRDFSIAVVPLAAVGRNYPVVEACRRVLGFGRPGANGARVEGRLVGDNVLGNTAARC